jgi:hypothetical protein
MVVLSDTRSLLDNLFELEDLGARAFTGIAEAVRVRAAYRKSVMPSRSKQYARLVSPPRRSGGGERTI